MNSSLPGTELSLTLFKAQSTADAPAASSASWMLSALPLPEHFEPFFWCVDVAPQAQVRGIFAWKAPSRGHPTARVASKAAAAKPGREEAFDRGGFEKFSKFKFPKEINPHCKPAVISHTENGWVKCPANSGCYLRMNSPGSFSYDTGVVG